MIDVRNKMVTVIGAARSGVGAALMLDQRGARVFVTDAGKIPPFVMDRLRQAHIPFETGKHSERASDAEYAVISPGVPGDVPFVKALHEKGIPVWSELEWASTYLDGHVVAVTGSNGKTTTTTWIDDMWKRAGRTHVTAGNIGSALSEHVAAGIPSWTDIILEVSSFQLDHIDTFRPNVSLLLNITPDHLNRYQFKFENYIASKFRIFENQKASDILIYWADDPVIRTHIGTALKHEQAPQIWTFSSETPVARGAFIRDGMLIIRADNQDMEVIAAGDIGLKGRHNLHNAMAAALAGFTGDIPMETIRESLNRFEGVEHRLELVRVLDGIRYVNDSKATNVNAVWYALDSLETPVVLILGGRDKGNDYSELNTVIREKVHTVIAIGEGASSVHHQLTDIAPKILDAATMQDAVRLARNVAARGETVLLSPACASFDMFENYEHRGNVFKKAVHDL